MVSSLSFLFVLFRFFKFHFISVAGLVAVRPADAWSLQRNVHFCNLIYDVSFAFDASMQPVEPHRGIPRTEAS